MANIRTSKKYIGLNELSKTNNVEVSLPDNSLFRHDLLNRAKEVQLDSQLSKHNFVLQSHKLMCLSIHQMILQFCKTGTTFADDFLEHSSNVMSEDFYAVWQKSVLDLRAIPSLGMNFATEELQH